MHISRLPLNPRSLPRALTAAPTRSSVFVRGVETGSHMSQDPDVLEKEKKRTLEGKVTSQNKNAPGWNEKLASVSESAVRGGRKFAFGEEPFADQLSIPSSSYTFKRSRRTG
jgi:hypothetical protein